MKIFSFFFGGPSDEFRPSAVIADSSPMKTPTVNRGGMKDKVSSHGFETKSKKTAKTPSGTSTPGVKTPLSSLHSGSRLTSTSKAHSVHSAGGSSTNNTPASTSVEFTL